MSHSYDRVSAHDFKAKRGVEQRLADHNHECNEAIIKIQLDIAVSKLNEALRRMELK